MSQLYDRIGVGYRALRRPDSRIAAAIAAALGPAVSVVNVGAGAGSYEPVDRPVVAVEPSLEMIHKRPAGSAPVVQASAPALPFRAGSSVPSLRLACLAYYLRLYSTPWETSGFSQSVRPPISRTTLRMTLVVNSRS